MSAFLDGLDGPRLFTVLMLAVSTLGLLSAGLVGLLLQAGLLIRGVHYIGPWRFNWTKASADVDDSRERRVLRSLHWVAFVSLMLSLVSGFVLVPWAFS